MEHRRDVQRRESAWTLIAFAGALIFLGYLLFVPVESARYSTPDSVTRSRLRDLAKVAKCLGRCGVTPPAGATLSDVTVLAIANRCYYEQIDHVMLLDGWGNPFQGKVYYLPRIEMVFWSFEGVKR